MGDVLVPKFTQQFYSVRFLGFQAMQSDIKVNNAIADGLCITLRLVIAFTLIIVSKIPK